MKVVAIPCLTDNYAYLVINEDNQQAAVIDPSTAPPVVEAIQKEQVKLTAILLTHHHWDHIGGINHLIKNYPNLDVYGHVRDEGRIPHQSIYLEAGNSIEIAGMEAEILHNPGHTRGAISYAFDNALFTGDTLFAGGCGRLLEGTPEEMYHSLNEKIVPFAGDRKLYFGHEYTEKNLRFALTVEPNNQDIQKRLEKIQKLRSKGKFTTPSTLEEEKLTNPFLRCESPEIQETVRQQDPANDLSPLSVFKRIRMMKDNF